LLALVASALAAQAAEPAGSNQADERFWQSIATQPPPGTTSLRRLFVFLRSVAEGHQHPERLDRVLDLAAQAQNRDPKSPTCGNFKWLWRDAGVSDPNAVEFVVQDAVLAWIRHKDWMPDAAREKLRAMLGLSAEACLRHRVPVTYTNIAILNAGNVAVLGEILGRPDVADEGYRRLEAICLWTWYFGIAEYCSPTYYGVDLDGLEFILSFARRERGRQQATALRRLFWTDIAMNFFPAAEKLAGSHSRSYDYLRGIGSLDAQLAAAGWLRGGVRDRLNQWSPERPAGMAAIYEAARTQFPRVVRQRWGMALRQSRTHALYADVTLSCSASAYSYQDAPLTIDLPGDRNQPRCYFIADGREDPYGKTRIETGTAKHLKAVHLVPFWTAAQRNCDALAVAVYRAGDLNPAAMKNLQSHLVLRRPTDGIWLSGRMGLQPVLPGVPVGIGAPIVLRYGTAAVGIRLLWTRARDGRSAVAALVDDGNPFGVIRLTVEHRRDAVTAEAGAAIWVRAGSGLANDSAFHAWRERFERSTPSAAEASESCVRFQVPGEEGDVSILARAPFGQGGGVNLEPMPTRAVLEVNGKDIGGPILETVEPIRSEIRGRDPTRPIDVPAQGRALWEAEDGLILHGMMVAEDTNASRGRCVVQPVTRHVQRMPGSATWPLRVAKAGRYYLWARVFAPDHETNSFHIVLESDWDELPVRDAWHLRPGSQWNWQCLSLGKSGAAVPVDLPAGQAWLQIRTREPGAKIDRLLLTSNPNERPE
jgi:hypothetical protein